MKPLTNETIRDAVIPWKTSNPKSHKNYAKIVNRFGHISRWNVSAVTNMSGMFCLATTFNQDISAWDVSAVTDMCGMFYSAMAFNQDISAWNVASVTNMHYMFYSARVFNQDISGWGVVSVTNMRGMFCFAMAFNQDISAWNVAAVTNMSDMFEKTLLFRHILHKRKLIHPFDLPQAHAYHNWARRKRFMHTKTFNCTVPQKVFIAQMALAIPEMRQEIGLFV
jgi:surface protein